MSFMSRSLLIFLRHGESVVNKLRPQKWFVNSMHRDSLLQALNMRLSDAHVPLTELGKEQAREAAATVLKKFGKPDVVLASPYVRTDQTCDETAAVLGCANVVRGVDRLRERDAGYTSLMTDGEVTKAFPWLQDYWRHRGPYYAKPPGGESIADVANLRARPVINDVIREYPDQTRLFVTHGNFMRAVRCVLEGQTVSDYEAFTQVEIDNCAILAYEWDGDRWVLVS